MDGEAKVQLILELKNKLNTGLNQAKNYLNQNVQEMKAKINELKDKTSSGLESTGSNIKKLFDFGTITGNIDDLKMHHVKAMDAIRDTVPHAGRAMDLLGNKYLMVGAAIVGVIGFMAKASAAAQEFDTAMAKANTTAQEAPAQLAETKKIVLDYAANSDTRNAVNVAPKIYDVMLSSGLDKQTSLATIPVALKAMKAGFVDAETAARAFSKVMSSSGIKDVDVIVDKMFMVKNVGNAEFQDIANYLPKIIPVAHAVGYSIDEISGAFGFLTTKLSAEQSSTALENVFKVLSDSNVAKSFHKIGVEFYDAQHKARPLINVVSDLKDALHGTNDEQRALVLGSLGLDVEARNGLLTMMGDIDRLKYSIDNVTNAQGELNRQYDAAKTPLDGLIKLGNIVTEVMASMGEKINESLSLTDDKIQKVKTSLENVRDVVLAIGSVFVDLWKGIDSMFKPFEDLLGWTANRGWKDKKPASENGGAPLESSTILGNSSVTDFTNSLWQRTQPKPVTAPTNVYEKPTAKVQAVLNEAGKKDKGKSGKSSDNTDRIQGSTPRTVNITINKVIDGDFITKNEQFANMGPADFQRWFVEMMMRVKANAEMGYN